MITKGRRKSTNMVDLRRTNPFTGRGGTIGYPGRFGWVDEEPGIKVTRTPKTITIKKKPSTGR